ncbi:ABC-type transport system involved in Fe-S cluster assembly fused permease/ATPase subunit [Streptomyces sp. V1I1]|nr:transposase [Streptomyces sp. V1I1]MDQ0938391.1 ABC-type transport system involved in Fe-S cluster assembly fused permease/ATPase subunit [Streptomyces sp. V1I1]
MLPGRCLPGNNDSSKGLTHGEISAHLTEVYGANVSKATISTIIDKVMDGMAEWVGHMGLQLAWCAASARW